MSDYNEEQDVEGPKVLIEIGQWAVTHEGIMMGRPPYFTYEIEAARLGQDDWCAHIFDKEDGTFLEFVEALYQGRRVHKIGDTVRTRTLMVPEPHDLELLKDADAKERFRERGTAWEIQTADEVLGLASRPLERMRSVRKVPVTLDTASAKVLWERCLSLV